MAAKSSLDNILGLLELISPKGGGKSTTTNTSTKSNNMSPEGVQAYIDSILGGTQGLAAISQGQRGSGLYNSTTNQLLTNDLLARTSAEAAKLNSSETTTNTQTQNITPTAQVSPGMAAGGAALLGISSLLAPTVKAGAKKFGLDNLGESLSSALFGGGSADFNSAGNTSFNLAPAATNFLSGASTNYGSLGSGFATDVFDGFLKDTGFLDSTMNWASDFFGGWFADGGRIPAYADGGTVTGGNRKALTADQIIAQRLQSGERPERLGVMNYIMPEFVDPGTNPNPGARQQQQLQAQQQDQAKVLEQVRKLASDLLNPPPDSISLLRAKVPGDGQDTGLPSGGLTGNYANFEDIIAASSMQGQGTGVQTVDTASLYRDWQSGYNLLQEKLNNALKEYQKPWERGNPMIGQTRDAYNAAKAELEQYYATRPDGIGAPAPTGTGGIGEGSGGGGVIIGGGSNNAGSGPGGTPVGGGGSGVGGVTTPGGPTYNWGGTGSGTAFANGGRLPGHDTKGKDSIRASVSGGGQVRLSGGEYIIPTDVTDMIGEETLDAIVAALHTPLRK